LKYIWILNMVSMVIAVPIKQTNKQTKQNSVAF
jgi:hypothetical protein